MRKTKLLLFALVLTLGVGMLVGCNKKSNELTEQEITSFAVLTSARLNSQVVGGNYVQDSDMNLIDEKTINDIDKYFAVLEYYLDGGSIAQDTVESDYEDEEGNKPYEHMIEWRMPSKEGHVTYIFHYNETLTEEDIEDDEHEQEFSISGIMVFEDVVMTVHGEIEKEFRIYKDKLKKDKDYIYLEIEQEVDEQSFHYSVYKGGNQVHVTKVELNTDDKQVELQLLVEIKTSNPLKFSMRLKLQGDRFAGYYKIENDKNESGYITLQVKKDDDRYVYEYTISNKKVIQTRSTK